jgi:hypothetical protein
MIIKQLVALIFFATAAWPIFADEGGISVTDAGQLEVSSSTFTCIRDMTKVRGFYVDNLKGDLEGTLAIANSETGGVYPAGSVVQLVPGEVMIKHEAGFSPATKGWEFFELDVSEALLMS